MTPSLALKQSGSIQGSGFVPALLSHLRGGYGNPLQNSLAPQCLAAISLARGTLIPPKECQPRNNTKHRVVTRARPRFCGRCFVTVRGSPGPRDRRLPVLLRIALCKGKTFRFLFQFTCSSSDQMKRLSQRNVKFCKAETGETVALRQPPLTRGVAP